MLHSQIRFPTANGSIVGEGLPMHRGRPPPSGAISTSPTVRGRCCASARGMSLYTHLGGSRTRATLDLLAAAASAEPIVTPWVLAIPTVNKSDPAPSWLRVATASQVRIALRTQGKTERTLGRPQANVDLPEALRLEELDTWLRLDESVSAMATSIWVADLEDSVLERLRKLLTIAQLPDSMVGIGAAND